MDGQTSSIDSAHAGRTEGVAFKMIHIVLYCFIVFRCFGKANVPSLIFFLCIMCK